MNAGRVKGSFFGELFAFPKGNSLVGFFEEQNLAKCRVFTIRKNYKDALRKLEEEGKIIADPPASKRRKRQGKITLRQSETRAARKFHNGASLKFPLSALAATGHGLNLRKRKPTLDRPKHTTLDSL